MARKTSATPPTPSVTDSVNGATTYTEDTFVTYADGSDQVRQSVFSLGNSAAGTPTLTVVTAGSVGGIQVQAYSGLDTSASGVDKQVSATGTGTSGNSGTTAATTGANEMVYGSFCDTGWGNVLTSTNQGSGSTFRGAHSNDVTNYEGFTEDKDSGTSGTTQTSAFTALSQTGTIWGMNCAVYKLPGGAATIPPGDQLWEANMDAAIAAMMR